MKYDPDTRRAERGDRERHQQIRERLSFLHPPTAEEVAAIVDSLVRQGLLPTDLASPEL